MPPLWQQWLDMAEETLLAARLVKSVSSRSAASRFYYAAFQAATALIHYRGGLQPPTVDGVQWEHWGHDKTPSMVLSELKALVKASNAQRAKKELAFLYRMRLYADYAGTTPISNDTLRRVEREAGFLVKLAQSVCTEGRG